MTLEEQVYNADRAKEVLDNEAFQAAVREIQAEIMQQWETSPARDVEGREKLWLMLGLLKKLTTTLETTMAGGRHAMAELRHKQTLAERATAWLRE